jgi:hypothetical protein
VACYDNVFDFQVEDGKLDNREQADVGVVDDVGDVAMDEDVARFAAQDGRLGHSRVRAADPENRRRLAFGAGGEEVGVFGADFLGPFLVAVETVVVCIFCGREHGALVCVWIMVWTYVDLMVLMLEGEEKLYESVNLADCVTPDNVVIREIVRAGVVEGRAVLLPK